MPSFATRSVPLALPHSMVSTLVSVAVVCRILQQEPGLPRGPAKALVLVSCRFAIHRMALRCPAAHLGPSPCRPRAEACG
jgi:hypothetical protein